MEMAALPVLNSTVLEPYGRATTLRVDSSAKTIACDLELKGEKELVQVCITKYEIIEANDGVYLVLQEVETSRAWLTTLADRLLLNRRLRLSQRVAAVLSRIL